MSTTLRFTKDSFLHVTDYDALQDFFQNWADQAFGIDQKLPMKDWQSPIASKRKRWFMKGEEIFKYRMGGRLVATIVIRQKYDTDFFDIELINEDVVVDRDLFITMGLSTKRRNNLNVGCKGVGAKNGMGGWVAHHGKGSIKVITGDQSWYPHFNGDFEERDFSISIRTIGYSRSFRLLLWDACKEDLEKLFHTVLWLSPPAEEDIIFTSAEGQLLSPRSSYARELFLYHNFISAQTMACGVNLFPFDKKAINVTMDRRNLTRDSKDRLIILIAKLWKKALEEKPNCIVELYDIVNNSQTSVFECIIAKEFANLLHDEFQNRNQPNRAYPVTSSMKELVHHLKDFTLVECGPFLAEILVDYIGKPDDILRAEMEHAIVCNVTDEKQLRWVNMMEHVFTDNKPVVFVEADERLPFMVETDEKIIFNSHHFQLESPQCDDVSYFGTMLSLLQQYRSVPWKLLPLLLPQLTTRSDDGDDEDDWNERDDGENSRHDDNRHSSDVDDDDASIVWAPDDNNISNNGNNRIFETERHDTTESVLGKRERIDEILGETKRKLFSIFDVV